MALCLVKIVGKAVARQRQEATHEAVGECQAAGSGETSLRSVVMMSYHNALYCLISKM